jgi:hypothetical protein
MPCAPSQTWYCKGRPAGAARFCLLHDQSGCQVLHTTAAANNVHILQDMSSIVGKKDHSQQPGSDPSTTTLHIKESHCQRYPVVVLVNSSVVTTTQQGLSAAVLAGASCQRCPQGSTTSEPGATRVRDCDVCLTGYWATLACRPVVRPKTN